MNKILKLAHNKRAFHCQLCTDGVSATILYDKPKVQAKDISDEELIKMYRANLFTYELGIDPGYRTWNATVRINIRTGEEVSLIEHKLM